VRGRLLRTAVVCSAVVLLAVPGGASGSSTRPGAQLTEVTITTLPIEPAALAYYAKDRGFFARQGIEAKIVSLQDPRQLTAALISGEAQVTGLNVGGTAIAKSRGLPIRVVAAGAMARRAAPTSGLVAAPGRRILRPRDLRGRSIAIDAANTIAHIGVLKWLKRGGVSAGEVRFVEMPFPLMLEPLKRRTIDAAYLPEPLLTIAKAQGAKPVGAVFDAVCSTDCLLTFWLARRDMSPELAARFRNAIQAAAVWANKKRNDRASAAILAKYVPIPKSALAKMTRTRFSERLRPALAQPWIDVYAEFGVIPESFRAIDLVK
jgi:ABC-type nitrate/sulfonate/bicarbonate transport system substrate-binding protein